MSKISLGTMFILSAALAACSDSRSPEQLTRSEPLPVGVEARQRMGVATVYFSFDGVQLNSQAQLLLDAEAARMIKNARSDYVIVGHADKVGSPDYNHDLGMRRALSVVTYLVSKGVPRDRLVPTASFGELSPVVVVDQAERLNRRVVILEKNSSGSAKALMRDEGERARDRLAAGPEQPQFQTPPTSGGLSDLPGETETPDNETPDQSETPPPSQQEPESNPGGGEDGGTGGDESGSPTEEPGNQQPGEPEDEQSSGNGSGGQGNGNGNGGQGNGQGSGSSGGSQSGTHTDAGRGNGAEEGDPGNSGGRNQGGDND
ncbi:OmpA family protein [Silicimonas algicola]|uniref:Outer membrane protein OmpA-like peptidoglycan-associated protein n=1 Tax=Silicimonas algicola TaxID=1826607 RepID=A0A316G4K7_9RHOB|nr:OmpA family protein [Silicimonas algicola]AZQ68646.1 OmpA family protein [Silicimonas algicola]PWK55623.1 outer membrane protein OmpA-like peptidoglycan-associated protein [Silicimonas algicola]